MSTSFYLAGPMTGLPQFNFPAFIAAAAELRARGLTIISPAELDGAEVESAALASPDGTLGPDDRIAGLTWADMLARDVKLVADEVSGLILLPGWETSKGAQLECFVGLLTNKTFDLYMGAASLKNVGRAYIRARIL